MITLLRGMIGMGVLILGIGVGRSLPPLDGSQAPPPAPPPAAETTAPRRLEATVYLPLADGKGRPFSDAVWDEALGRLITPFGGATLRRPQEGYWVDARGRLAREPVRPLVISFAPERLGEFRKAVHDVGRRLGQEAMYVRFEEPRVDLISVAGARPGERR
jgi:hypothetical protein